MMAVFSPGSGALDEAGAGAEFEVAVAAPCAVSFLLSAGLLMTGAAVEVLAEALGATAAAEVGADGTETAADSDVVVDAPVDGAAGGGVDAESVAESEGADCPVV
jgi:hypothetical protein